jgi:hypothetical protein
MEKGQTLKHIFSTSPSTYQIPKELSNCRFTMSHRNADA